MVALAVSCFKEFEHERIWGSNVRGFCIRGEAGIMVRKCNAVKLTKQRETCPQESDRPRPPAFIAGVTIVEVMITIVIILIAIVGTSAFRYHSTLLIRRAEVRTTAARLAAALLNGWKGAGSHSGYSAYELLDPSDYNPSDPNDYNPNDIDPVEFGLLGLRTYFNVPGPPVAAGFSALDTNSNPNYRFVIDGVNYYVTLSYQDEVGEPRLLSVCVAWMNGYQLWDASASYQSVNLAMYGND